MKHENINTLVALLGLSLAVYSVFLQVREKPDDLLVGRAFLDYELLKLSDGDAPVKKGDSYIQKFDTIWAHDVYNPMDRAVSVNYMAMSVAQNSTMYPGGLPAGFLSDRYSNGTGLQLPITMDPRQSRRFFWKLPTFIKFSEQNSSLCYDSQISLFEFESCLNNQGFDLFGNKTDVVRRADLQTRQSTFRFYIPRVDLYLTTGSEVELTRTTILKSLENDGE